MPETRKPAAPSAKAEAEAEFRQIERIAHLLETAQKDVSAIGDSVESGMRDLARDVERLLRDARRDLGKMRTAVQRDLDRLQKDLRKPPAKPAAARRAAAEPRRTRASSARAPR